MSQMRLGRLSPLAGLCACLLLSGATGSSDATMLIQSSVEGHAKVLLQKNESLLGVPDSATAELGMVAAKVADAGAPASAVAPPLHVRQILKRKRISDEKRRKTELKERWQARQQREKAAEQEKLATPAERLQADRERALALEEEVKTRAKAQAAQARVDAERQKHRETMLAKAKRLESYERLQKMKALQSKNRERDLVKREKSRQWEEDMKEKQRERKEAEKRAEKKAALSLSRAEQSSGKAEAMNLHLRGPRPNPPLLMEVSESSRMGAVAGRVAHHFGIDPKKVVIKLNGRRINNGDGPLKQFGLMDGDALDVEAAP